MRYVVQGSAGGYDFGPFEKYLADADSELVACIDGDFLAADRNGFSGPGSFHDARLEMMQASTVRGSTSLHLQLKGPYFDRFFELAYEEVVEIRMSLPAPDEDLVVHELRLENGVLIHELQFAVPEHRVEIHCARLRFREVLAAAGGST